MKQVALRLWKKLFDDGQCYDYTSWLFFRLFGLIALSAFVSFAVQAIGLIGSHGILPLPQFIDAVRQTNNIGLAPMIFLLDGSDAAILTVAWTGAFFSFLLFLGFLPRFSLLVIYVFYLSIMHAGQAFMTFQWDYLLVQTAFLALVLTFAQRQGIWLLRWLTFCFMWGGGLVKVTSGDTSWLDLTALNYHFETQPLPTPLAYYVHFWPHILLKFGVLATLVIELVVPFFIFMGRRLRFVAGFAFLFLQMTIFLTGNYNFFNLNTMVLCLTLFDDKALQKALPLHPIIKRLKPVNPHKLVTYCAGMVVLFVVLISGIQFQIKYTGYAPGSFISNASVQPYALINSYGPFAVMTRARPEIIFEGSYDGLRWQEYGFKYKPGDVTRRTSWNIPHQPRLDWQMWFAALGPIDQSPWVYNFIERLLQGEPDVLALLQDNPFPSKPPKYIRAVLYEYRFIPPDERKVTGAYWQRNGLGLYLPSIRLKETAERSPLFVR